MSGTDNEYPSPLAYPVSSFVRPVPPPLESPDVGDLILVRYNKLWTPLLMACLEQLSQLPSTWEGEHSDIVRGLNDGALLQYLLQEPAELDVPTPYWDDASDLDDEAPVETQSWYGIFDGEFHETVENFAIAGFLAYAGAPGAAIRFLTIAPAFRLAWKKSDLGGIVHLLIDGADYGSVNTNGDEGVLEKNIVADPDLDEHEIIMYLEAVP